MSPRCPLSLAALPISFSRLGNKSAHVDPGGVMVFTTVTVAVSNTKRNTITGYQQGITLDVDCRGLIPTFSVLLATPRSL